MKFGATLVMFAGLTGSLAFGGTVTQVASIPGATVVSPLCGGADPANPGGGITVTSNLSLSCAGANLQLVGGGPSVFATFDLPGTYMAFGGSALFFVSGGVSVETSLGGTPNGSVTPSSSGSFFGIQNTEAFDRVSLNIVTGGTTFILTDFQLLSGSESGVPEPSSMAMAGPGVLALLSGLCWRARRKASGRG